MSEGSAVELVPQVKKWMDSEQVLPGKTVPELSNAKGGRTGGRYKNKKKRKN